MSESSSATIEIYRRIPLIMGELGAVAKERQAQAYRYRGIDDFYLACQPLFAKHGVFVIPRVLEESHEERASKQGGALLFARLRVAFLFTASDGSHLEAITIGEAMDSSDKASSKAMSVAMKYALMQVLCIPSDEPDMEIDMHDHNPLPKNARPPIAPPHTVSVSHHAPDVSRRADPPDAERLAALIGIAPDAAAMLALGPALAKLVPEDRERLRAAYEARLGQLIQATIDMPGLMSFLPFAEKMPAMKAAYVKRAAMMAKK